MSKFEIEVDIPEGWEPTGRVGWHHVDEGDPAVMRLNLTLRPLPSPTLAVELPRGFVQRRGYGMVDVDWQQSDVDAACRAALEAEAVP